MSLNSPDNSPVERFLEGLATFSDALSSRIERFPVERFLEGLAAFSDALSWRLAMSTYVLGRCGWSEAPLGNMTEHELSDALLEPFLKRLSEMSDEEVKNEPDKAIEEVKGEVDTAIFEYFRRDDYTRLSES